MTITKDKIVPDLNKKRAMLMILPTKQYTHIHIRALQLTQLKYTNECGGRKKIHNYNAWGEHDKCPPR